MNNIEFWKKAIETDKILELDFIFQTFTINRKDSKWYRTVRGKLEGNLGDDWIQLEGDPKDTLLKIGETLILTDKDMSCVGLTDEFIKTGKLKTTIGISLVNYVLIEYALKGKLEYTNTPDIGNIESDIAVMLVEDKDVNDSNISVSERESFDDSVSYLKSMNSIFVVSSTPKLMSGDPDRTAKKKKAKDYIINKYGENCLEDYAHVVELENLYKQIDIEYLKDDPTFGVVASGKILNTSRPKKFGSFGAEPGFNTGGKAHFIDRPLDQGYSMKPEDLVVYFDTLRAGSYSRAAATVQGGVDAKYLSASTKGYSVEKDDCMVTHGLTLTIDKQNWKSLVGHTRIVDKKMIKISTRKEAKIFIDKTIEIRSNQFCRLSKNTYCAVCSGDNFSRYKRGISLDAMGLGGGVLKASMKAMHASTTDIIAIDNISDILS